MVKKPSPTQSKTQKPRPLLTDDPGFKLIEDLANINIPAPNDRSFDTMEIQGLLMKHDITLQKPIINQRPLFRCLRIFVANTLASESEFNEIRFSAGKNQGTATQMAILEITLRDRRTSLKTLAKAIVDEIKGQPKA